MSVSCLIRRDHEISSVLTFTWRSCCVNDLTGAPGQITIHCCILVPIGDTLLGSFEICIGTVRESWMGGKTRCQYPKKSLLLNGKNYSWLQCTPTRKMGIKLRKMFSWTDLCGR